MRYPLIAGLGIALLILVFAIQNAVKVSVVFLLWRLDASLTAVIASCFVMGAVIGVLITVPAVLRERILAGRLRKQVEALTSENSDLRSRPVHPVQL